MEQSETTWCLAPELTETELIELVLASNPNKTRKQVRDQIRHSKTYASTKTPLPRRGAIPRLTARAWLLKHYPDMQSLPGMKGYEMAVEFEHTSISIPPKEELVDAYRTLARENLKLKARLDRCHEQRNELQRRPANWGRPKE